MCEYTITKKPGLPTLFLAMFPETTIFIISSFHELMQSRGVRRPSVRPSVRLSVNFDNL